LFKHFPNGFAGACSETFFFQLSVGDAGSRCEGVSLSEYFIHANPFAYGYQPYPGSYYFLWGSCK